MAAYFLSVDGGGTSSTFLAASPEGAELARFTVVTAGGMFRIPLVADAFANALFRPGESPQYAHYHPAANRRSRVGRHPHGPIRQFF